jgi:TrpR-related protein YerC/YecD
MPGKVKYHELTESEKKKYLGDFYSIIATLKNREDAKDFFKDLLTISEVVMISRRIQIAMMLFEGNTQEEIRKKLRVGFTNIAQVEKWLNNGFGGYRKTIGEYTGKIAGIKTQKEKRAVKESMLKKYPHHRFLLDLISGK